jgi:hypothetical protein
MDATARDTAATASEPGGERPRRRRDDRAAREDRALRGGRPRRPQPHGAVPDGDFGFLTRAQADRLRALTVAAFAAAGVEVDVSGGVARAPGRSFGLAQLAAACLDAVDGGSERAWPEVVRRHVARLLATDGAAPLSHLPLDEVLAGTYLRVVGRATLPDEALDRLRYARPLAGDLLELLAFRPPGADEGVRLLQDDDLLGFVPGLLRAAGVANLLRLLPGEHEVVEGPRRQRLHVVTGPSPFTASTLLVLPEVLGRAAPELPGRDGVLVAVPFRHQLAFAPVEAATVLDLLELMVPFAERGYAQGVGAVSPFVYWWRPEGLTQVSVLTERGTWAIDDTGDFGTLLDRLLG